MMVDIHLRLVLSHNKQRYVGMDGVITRCRKGEVGAQFQDAIIVGEVWARDEAGKAMWIRYRSVICLCGE